MCVCLCVCVFVFVCLCVCVCVFVCLKEGKQGGESWVCNLLDLDLFLLWMTSTQIVVMRKQTKGWNVKKSLGIYLQFQLSVTQIVVGGFFKVLRL